MNSEEDKFISPASQEQDLSRLKLAIISAGIYLILAIIVTWPLAPHFFSSIPAKTGDAWVHLWHLWWVKYSLFNLHINPFHTNFIMYPMMLDLIFTTHDFFTAIITMPVQLIFNTIVAFNCAVLLSFVAAGLGCQLLIIHLLPDDSRYYTKHLAAFIGGFIFAFCPYKFAHLPAHLNLINYQWIPWYLYFLFLTIESKYDWRYGTATGFFLLAQTLTEYNYFVYLVVITIIFFLAHLHSSHQLDWLTNSFWLKIATIYGFFLVLFAPFIYLGLNAMVRGELISHPWAGKEISADLLAYLTPSVFHPIWGNWAAKTAQNFPGHAREWTVFLGWSVFLLGLAGMVMAIKIDWRWRFLVIICILFFLLSLGLTIYINGKPYSEQGIGKVLAALLPFKLLQRIPVLSMSRIPTRFALMVVFSFALFSSLAIWKIDQIFKALKWRGAFISAVFIIIFIEYLPPLPAPITKLQLPEVYTPLIEDRGDVALLETPLGIVSAFAHEGYPEPIYMAYQIYHHKRIFSGYLARTPRRVIDKFLTQPLTRTIVNYQKNKELNPADVEIDLEKGAKFARAINLRYLILRGELTDSPLQQHLASFLPLEQYYKSGTTVGFKVVWEKQPNKIE